MARSIRYFRDFISNVTDLADQGLGEGEMLARAKPLMTDLLADDGWYPAALSQPGETGYSQNLLWCDIKERFSIVSFVWGPGQETPIHDHCVWGLLGVLRGSEIGQRFVYGDGRLHASGSLETVEAGDLDVVSPTVGDIHKVRNGSKGISVSVHLYGGNIGAIDRHLYSLEAPAKTFRSGYSAVTLPNIWRDETTIRRI